jgi:citrate lyase gamma subunit
VEGSETTASGGTNLGKLVCWLKTRKSTVLKISCEHSLEILLQVIHTTEDSKQQHATACSELEQILRARVLQLESEEAAKDEAIQNAFLAEQQHRERNTELEVQLSAHAELLVKTEASFKEQMTSLNEQLSSMHLAAEALKVEVFAKGEVQQVLRTRVSALEEEAVTNEATMIQQVITREEVLYFCCRVCL